MPDLFFMRTRGGYPPCSPGPPLVEGVFVACGRRRSVKVTLRDPPISRDFHLFVSRAASGLPPSRLPLVCLCSFQGPSLYLLVGWSKWPTLIYDSNSNLLLTLFQVSRWLVAVSGCVAGKLLQFYYYYFLIVLFLFQVSRHRRFTGNSLPQVSTHSLLDNFLLCLF